MMNELGKPFKVFNHAGILRQDDHGSPPDGSAVLEHMPSADLNGPVAGPRDFMHRLANSPRVKRCFIRQTFRFFMGRPETIADACTLERMESAYDDTDGSFTSMLEAFVTSDAFRFRHHTEEISP